MRYTVLSFDLDASLVDTAGELAEAANRTIEDFGIARRAAAEIAPLAGGGARELMLRLLSKLLRERPQRAPQLHAARVLARFAHHRALLAGSSARPRAGCGEALRRLATGGVHLACVTDDEERSARRVLRACQLDDAFDLLVGGDTLPCRKPDRAVIEHVLRTLGGHPGTAAHIGHSRIDLATARNGGIAAWAVPNGRPEAEVLEAPHPVRVFESLPDLADHVLMANRLAAVELWH